VLDYQQMPEVVQRMSIRMAMLTVPSKVAQEVADDLVKAGICAILNYTPVPLNLPSTIQVQYVDPIVKLQHMSYYL
jgi:redox-sensing transcriptional repressor